MCHVSGSWGSSNESDTSAFIYIDVVVKIQMYRRKLTKKILAGSKKKNEEMRWEASEMEWY